MQNTEAPVFFQRSPPFSLFSLPETPSAIQPTILPMMIATCEMSVHMETGASAVPRVGSATKTEISAIAAMIIASTKNTA